MGLKTREPVSKSNIIAVWLTCLNLTSSTLFPPQKEVQEINIYYFIIECTF